MPIAVRGTIAALVVLAIALGHWSLSGMGTEGRALGFALLAGAAFGLVLQRSRFCFYCNFRDFLERREPMGVLAILVALAVGATGYTAIFGAWLPTPAPERLPPTAHIGPVSVVLMGASFVFGLGMAISGSCLSAHFYRLGEGSPVAPFAIIGGAAGFFLGFITWNPLFEAATSEAVIVWLPHSLGYAGSLAVTLALLAGLSLIILRFAKPSTPAERTPMQLRAVLHALFVTRWPGVGGGVLVGFIATLYYFRVAPLGVTSELGSLVRTAATSVGAVPETLYGLDVLRGCATLLKETLFSNNGVFVLGLIGASLASALIAGQFKPRWPTRFDVGRGLVGGLLLGWGAMTALGCTVGVLLSGIHAGALSGWVFLICCTAGTAAGIILGRRLGIARRFAAAAAAA